MTEETNKIEAVETTEAPAKAGADKKKQASKYIRTAKGKKRVAQSVPRGRVYVTASLNNTIVTVTDQNGNTIAWASAGGSGFRGPKKATPYAASKVIENVSVKLEELGVKELTIYVKGIGSGRDSAIRTLNSKGFSILGIKELTPVPHNGCRPRRARRV